MHFYNQAHNSNYQIHQLIFLGRFLEAVDKLPSIFHNL